MGEQAFNGRRCRGAVGSRWLLMTMPHAVRPCLLGSDKSTSESRPALHFLSTENLPIAERNTLRHELAMQREGFRVTTPFMIDPRPAVVPLFHPASKNIPSSQQQSPFDPRTRRQYRHPIIHRHTERHLATCVTQQTDSSPRRLARKHRNPAIGGRDR